MNFSDYFKLLFSSQAFDDGYKKSVIEIITVSVISASIVSIVAYLFMKRSANKKGGPVRLGGGHRVILLLLFLIFLFLGYGIGGALYLMQKNTPAT